MMVPKYPAEPVQAQSNVPKCPTCGSTNIVKISGAERALNAAAFGLLGNRRKYHWLAITVNMNGEGA